VTRHSSIPVTTVARTIEDLRGGVSEGRYRHAIRQAEFKKYELSPATPSDGTRSMVEKRFLALCQSHGIPKPEVNVKIGRYTVDFLWRAERLVVETDTYGTHGGRQAFEDDRERDADLQLRGFRVLRVTEERIGVQPAAVARRIHAALSTARIPPSG